MVSSVLAFIGMVIGLVLGNIEDFSGWMFAATAGKPPLSLEENADPTLALEDPI